MTTEIKAPQSTIDHITGWLVWLAEKDVKRENKIAAHKREIAYLQEGTYTKAHRDLYQEYLNSHPEESDFDYDNPYPWRNQSKDDINTWSERVLEDSISWLNILEQEKLEDREIAVEFRQFLADNQ